MRYGRLYRISCTASDPKNKFGTMFLLKELSPVRLVAVRFHGSCRKVVTTELANVVMSDARIVSISISAKM